MALPAESGLENAFDFRKSIPTLRNGGFPLREDTMNEKQQVLAKVREQIRAQFERMSTAAKTSADYATDKDSRSESKYDTRSLEASYLAAGQVEQAEELADTLQWLETLELPDFRENDAIQAGALVEADFEGDLVFYLLLSRGGGITCQHHGCDLTVLTPDSPLGAKILGLRAGDSLESPALTIYTVA